MPPCKNILTVPEHEGRQRRKKERRWETGRVRGSKGREEGISNKMFTAWSVINAQILPESRGFQFNFKSQKVQSSCRGVREENLGCYLLPDWNNEGTVYQLCIFKQMRSREQSWQHPPCFHEQRNSQVDFQGPSLEQPCPMQQEESLQGWWHWFLCPAPSHLHRW